MKRKVDSWTVDKLEKERTRISFPEYQREKSLWSLEKKKLLIDSILEDVDIPKLYFNLLPDKSIEVIDGQQRLWSIWEYLDGEYACDVEGRSLKFAELTPSKKRVVQEYEFQIIIFQAADDAYLRKLFVRLQLGLLLNTGEKLHAAMGKMKTFVFNQLANDQFIQALGIPSRRYARQTLCAQIAINSFTKKKLNEFARTRYEDLINFFEQYADPTGAEASLYKETSQAIVSVLHTLWQCFGPRAKELTNRSYILSIFLFVEQVGVGKAEYRQFVDFVFLLWKRLKEEARKGMDRKNRELYSFQSLLSSAPGEEYQISRRHDKLVEYYEFYKRYTKIKGD